MPQQLTLKSRNVIAREESFGTTTRKEVYRDGSPPLIVISPDPLAYFTRRGRCESVSSVGHKGPPFKEGGPFLLKRYSVENGIVGGGSFYSGYNEVSTGDVTQVRVGFSTISDALRSATGAPAMILTSSFLQQKHDNISYPVTSLENYSAKAINKFSPIKPGANVGQALVELYRDGLPKLPLGLLSRLKNMKSLGSEYLNVQFGWVPLLNDLRALYKTQQSLDSQMRQIVRNNGRRVRRNGTIQATSETAVSDIPYAADIYPQFYGSLGPVEHGNTGKIQTTSSEKIWFSGSFRYYLPFTPTNEWPRRAVAALFGLNPTPALLYEVMPWSWLIDWFSNVGDVITALSSNGIAELITDYGYLMRHAKAETHYTYIGSTSAFYSNGVSNVPVPVPFSQVVISTTSETKERVVSSPFGFGLTIDDLSVRQLAILTALGLSRSNF